MALNETLQKVLLELKRQKKAESFPDGVYGQANRIMCDVGNICENVRRIKTDAKSREKIHIPFLKSSLISTMASCLRMIEELEKNK